MKVKNMKKKNIWRICLLGIIILIISIYTNVNYVYAESSYDVSTPHVIVNQIFGGTGGYVSHNFIELYNPTDSNVDLTGWSIHYISAPADSAHSSSWNKLELSGTINSNSSYLIRCASDPNYSRTDRTLNSYDISWDISIYNKGCAVVLMSSDDDISYGATVFSATEVIDGYVDMLAVSGNDGRDNQIPYAFETLAPSYQSKKCGIRRIDFSDTDNNALDAETVDYSQTNVSAFYPRCSADGAWVSASSAREMIEQRLCDIPKFYEEYCTESSALALSSVLQSIENLDESTETDLLALYNQLDNAINNLIYKSDSVIPQLYISTDDGNGNSYGSSFKKSIGYVSSSIVLVDTDQSVLVSDLNSKVKIRGNLTQYGVRKPYAIKLSSGVNLFGMGKSKNWVLLADCYDPTYMRNAVALKLASDLGLAYTPEFKRVEVFVDGSYRGIYLLVEKIEESSKRVDIDSSNGDFLLEMDRQSRAESGNIYIQTNYFWRLREPEDIGQDQIDDITNIIIGLEEDIASGDYSRVSTNIDIPSFVNYYIMNEYLKPGDFGSLSVYFYYKNGQLYAGPAWDYDLSTGNCSNEYPYYVTDTDYAYASICHFYKDLFKYPEFKMEVLNRYNELKSSDVFTNISSDSGYLIQEKNTYSDAIARSYALYDPQDLISGYNRIPDESYDENFIFLRNWLVNREAWMDEYIPGLITGIFRTDEGLYYYVNNVKTEAGLIIFDGEYYYVGDGGCVTTGVADVVNTNDLRLPAGTYEFDENGKMINVPVEYEAEEVIAADPRCVTDGNIRYWYVERTGKYYRDVACMEEISYEETVIPAIGHLSGFFEENIVYPTCIDTGGYDICEYCLVCDAELNRTHFELSTVDHTPGDTVYENVMESTWDEPGSYDECVYCAICGEELGRVHVNTPKLDDIYVMMYRLYNPNSGEHFWTGSIEERDNLVKNGWDFEGNGWVAPKTEGNPVYRLYNDISGDHHYTMSMEEMDILVAAGWNYEGVAWNSADTETGNPLYRMLNPNAAANDEAGMHFFTMSIEEKDNLVEAGWIYEGIGWWAS